MMQSQLPDTFRQIWVNIPVRHSSHFVARFKQDSFADLFE
jgi:hypothetical protein